MANRKWSDVQTTQTAVKLLGGHFVSAGSSSPTVVSGTGGFRVDRTGTGAYQVSCSGVGDDLGRYSKLLAVVPACMEVSALAPTSVSVELTAVDYPQSKFTLTTYSGTTAWDFPSSEAVVHFVMLARNTTYGT
jgi:hypothetical protein